MVLTLISLISRRISTSLFKTIHTYLFQDYYGTDSMTSQIWNEVTKHEWNESFWTTTIEVNNRCCVVLEIVPLWLGVENRKKYMDFSGISFVKWMSMISLWKRSQNHKHFQSNDNVDWFIRVRLINRFDVDPTSALDRSAIFV